MSKTATKSRRENAGILGPVRSHNLLALWAIPALVGVLTFATFLPVLNNGFLNWDDEAVLLNNTRYRGLSWTHLKWMATTFHHSLYRPLTWITWGGDYVIWGMNPLGYHLTSLLFHSANAVVFFFLALRLLRLATAETRGSEWTDRVSAGLAALLFSMHPLRVEPVAWVSGRENLVAGLFFLLTLLFYLKAVEPSRSHSQYRPWMALALAAFAASLLGKGAGMTLPFALLILDVYPLRRLPAKPSEWLQRSSWIVWYEKVPFICLGSIAAAVGWFAKHQEGAMFRWEDYGLLPRLAQSVYGLTFYLWKTLVPLGLSPLYELPLDILVMPWTIIGCGIILTVITTALFLMRNRYPAGLASWAFYIVIISPVLGISQSGPQFAADRYTYLACIGWPILVGAAVHRYWRAWAEASIRKGVLRVAAFAVLILVCLLGALSWRQTRIWHDSEVLWRHALAVSPSALGHYYLGLTLDRLGNFIEASQQYRKALDLRPNYFDARYALGGVLFRSGQLTDAADQYRLALKVHPGHATLHVDLANTLALQDRLEEALRHYHEALRISPTSANIYFNMGNSFARKGSSDKALASYRHALALNPAHSDAHFALANALASQDELSGAIEHYRQAVTSRPDFAEAYHNLGRVLAARGRIDEAIEQFRHAVRVRPGFAEAYFSLSQALAEQGRKDEAMSYYLEARRLIQSGRNAAVPSTADNR